MAGLTALAVQAEDHWAYQAPVAVDVPIKQHPVDALLHRQRKAERDTWGQDTWGQTNNDNKCDAGAGQGSNPLFPFLMRAPGGIIAEGEKANS